MRSRNLRNRCFGLMAAVLVILPAASWAQQIAIGAYSVPNANSYPYGITVGPDGALWFSQVFSIGRITTAGAITEYNTPGGTTTGFITVGPDGALWFTGTYANNIGRITTAGVFTNSRRCPPPTASLLESRRVRMAPSGLPKRTATTSVVSPQPEW